jgi:hypothetical protein
MELYDPTESVKLFLRSPYAEGEYSAAQRLVDAASLLAEQPVSVQLRYLQTLTEIGVEKNPFPVPVDIFSRITKALEV